MFRMGKRSFLNLLIGNRRIRMIVSCLNEGENGRCDVRFLRQFHDDSGWNGLASLDYVNAIKYMIDVEEHELD